MWPISAMIGAWSASVRTMLFAQQGQSLLQDSGRKRCLSRLSADN